MKIFIIVLLTFILSISGELRSIYYYQGRVTFDKKMLRECLNTSRITQLSHSMIYISCESKWSPYINTLDIVLPTAVSKFNTECYGMIGEIYYGYLKLEGYYSGPEVTRDEVGDCLISNILGNRYDFNFIGVLPGNTKIH